MCRLVKRGWRVFRERASEQHLEQQMPVGKEYGALREETSEQKMLLKRE